MQFDEFDRKAIDAAERHHPAYDEKAWDKMEKLLDRHLPQKEEKKRRFLFWWWLPLLLCGIGFFVFKNTESKKNEPVESLASAQENRNSKTTIPVINKKDKGDKQPVSEQGKEIADIKTKAGEDLNKETGTTKTTKPADMPQLSAGDITVTDTKQLKKAGTSLQSRPIVRTNYNKSKTRPATNNESIKPNNEFETLPGKSVTLITANNPGINRNGQPVQKENKNTTTDSNNITETRIVSTGVPNPDTANQKKDEQSTSAVNTDKLIAKADTVAQDGNRMVNDLVKAKKRPGSSGFFAGVSFGGDISFVSGNKTGALKSAFGFGIGYGFKNRVSIRTGFYTARKIYTADGDSYKPSAQFTQYYPYLVSVNANCMVYEIPVSVAYNMSKKPSSGWFVSAGLSTLLMKKETYKYFYKYTPSGNIYSRDWSISNENKHYFSVATLSAGYQRLWGKRFLFMAEPYLKIPLSGIGFGKVKLNSGGLLFTVGYKLSRK